ncbi:hypothetical protein NHP214376_02840 [Helicobacter ailurogastricus]|nr:hypothetical protein NHP214376_02840 [Helicobacter ailurogastricus]GLH59405.1 hypothetical protein NHP214377_06720 [Helicobacter ailurogastricus]GMB92064.1 hypothetical protein NHP190009_12430 [Helicobacter ailurogastricus]
MDVIFGLGFDSPQLHHEDLVCKEGLTNMDLRLRAFLAPLLMLFFGFFPLSAIDIQALVEEQTKSADLAKQLVGVSNHMLEGAIDSGKNYQQVKQLDKFYQEARDLMAVLMPNKGTSKPTGLGAIFKKAIEPPIDLDKALSLTNTLQKEVKSANQDGLDYSQMLSVLNQLENSLQTALDLKSQWLDTRKAN